MPPRESLFSLFLLFLRFGVCAWGGPVAQLSMIREELVDRRQWIDPEKFKRVLAVYQALPGPEAHEICVYFGMLRHGRVGGLLAGLGFMLPGLLLILLLAWAYTALGPATLLPLFVGVAPAVAALIARAVHKIATHTLSGLELWLAAGLAVLLTLAGVHFIAVFVVCAAWKALWDKGAKGPGFAIVLILSAVCVAAVLYGAPHAGNNITAPAPGAGGLFVEGLKGGLLSFGGAYTALPFLKDSMVGVYPNISLQAFLDSIALTNMIPAPLVIFATFLGFLAGGLPGAMFITAGMFLPAFSFTLVGHAWLEKIIEHKSLHGVLGGIAAAVVGLLAVTALQVIVEAVDDPLSSTIFIVSLGALFASRRGWAAPAVIIVGGVAGYVLSGWAS